MKVTQSLILAISTALISAVETTPAFGDIETDTITTALIEATRDDQHEVRLAAYKALSTGPGTEAVITAFRIGLEDEDDDVQRTVLDAFVELEGPNDEVIRLLVSRLSDEATSAVAAENLRLIGQPAVPILLGAMDEPTSKQGVIDLLGRTSLGEYRPKVVEMIVSALKDDDKQVQLKAITALERIRSRSSAEVKSNQLAWAKHVLRRYDKNSDRVLTEDEWKAIAFARFVGSKGVRFADNDRDGQLTVDELADWISRR